MPTVKLTGFLVEAFPAEQITDKFRKRLFWLAEAEPRDARYANTWELELHQDDCERLDDFQQMELLEAECEVRGRKTEVANRQRVFVALKCIALNRSGAAARPVTPPRYEDRRRPPSRDHGFNPRPSHFPYRHQ